MNAFGRGAQYSDGGIVESRLVLPADAMSFLRHTDRKNRCIAGRARTPAAIDSRVLRVFSVTLIIRVGAFSWIFQSPSRTNWSALG